MKNSNHAKAEYLTTINCKADENTLEINKTEIQKLLLGRWYLESSTHNALTLLDRQSYFNFINKKTFTGTFYSKENTYGENISYSYLLTNDFQIHYHNASGLVILKIESITANKLIFSREVASKTVLITFKRIQ